MLDSFDYWDKLWRTVDAEQCGVKQLSVYAFSNLSETIVRVNIHLNRIFSKSKIQSEVNEQ